MPDDIAAFKWLQAQPSQDCRCRLHLFRSSRNYCHLLLSLFGLPILSNCIPYNYPILMGEKNDQVLIKMEGDVELTDIQIFKPSTASQGPM